MWPLLQSPNAGWLALVHFWPTGRKGDSFQHVTGILGQTQPLFSSCPPFSKSLPGNWRQPKLPIHRSGKQEKTGQFPLKNLHKSRLLPYISLLVHIWGDVHSATAGVRLTHAPPNNSSSCPFYTPSSLWFPVHIHFIHFLEHCRKIYIALREYIQSLHISAYCAVCTEIAVKLLQIVCYIFHTEFF